VNPSGHARAPRLRLLAAAAVCLVAACASPGNPAIAAQTSLFAKAQLIWGPSALGPAIGDRLPDLASLSFIGTRSVVAVAQRELPEALLPLFEDLSRRDGIRLVLAAEDLAPERASLAGQVVFLDGDDKAALCDAYRIGNQVSFLLLLVDDAGQVAYRALRLGVSSALALDRTVQAFAATGQVPDGTVLASVLTSGDLARLPAVVDGGKGPLSVDAFRPRLILRTNEYPTGLELEGLPAAMDALRREFPGVEFVWLVRTESPGRVLDTRTYLQRIGVPQESWAGPCSSVEECVAADLASQAQALSTTLAGFAALAPEWAPWVDVDDALAESWSFPWTSAVMLVDGQGRVVLPPTEVPLTLPEDAEWFVPDPRGIDELRALLQGMATP
jgi:hypothetical protein